METAYKGQYRYFFNAEFGRIDCFIVDNVFPLNNGSKTAYFGHQIGSEPRSLTVNQPTFPTEGDAVDYYYTLIQALWNNYEYVRRKGNGGEND